ncbi:hypothetical protein [Sphingomonas mesophila]|uniref:hypothetical protein n=1 Tax=Sphingomonas mesophila TaxID=2303576 RepID=UPI0013C37261|nr:hypothetical protein [Sphingomonas mesophila]
MTTRAYSPLHRLGRALLARGGAKVRGTDWWAVLVEIAIVVLGILIAFQLDAWADRRAERTAERLLWARLAEEARGDINALDNIIGEHLESAENYRLLAAASADPALADAYRRRGRDGCNLLRLPAVQRQSSGAIGQAVGARIELIRDPKLRRALRLADAKRVFSDRQLDYFRAAFDRYGERIEPHMRWTFTPSGAVACSVDVAALAADRAAVGLLPKLHRDQRTFARYRAAEARSLRSVERRALRLLGRGD